MDTINRNITKFFEKMLNDLECQPTTRAYIASIYGKYESADFDLSKDSVTLLFAQARNNHDFLTYQNLGDWIFFINTLAPKHLSHASKNYYDTVAKLSYYSCYKIINKQWKLFEELSDNFTFLEEQVKIKLNQNTIKNQTSSGIYIETF
jgi:hypothetical protein